MYYQAKTDMPSAYITKNKQRLKQHSQNVYLKNGSEFEIELFNPTSNSVLAKIKLNGNYISGGGIIIKPGQRVFLERYLDEAKKFVFETYEVNSKSKQVMDAIADNGDVTVEFYPESLPVLFDYDWNNYTTKRYYTNPNPTWTMNVGSTSNSTNNYYSNNGATFTTNSLNFGTSSKPTYSMDNVLRSTPKQLKSKKTIETGTVEKGSHSNQSFQYVNKTFSSFTMSISKWKILPESQKPYEANDLKTYCTNCGTKRKKDSFKFCPNCGEKF
jgi:hypothetical protein